MLRSITDKRLMYNTTLSFLDDNSDKVSTFEALVEKISDFRLSISKLDELIKKHLKATAGVMDAKDQSRVSLEGQLLAVAGKSYVYAKDMNLHDLKSITNLKQGVIGRMRDDILVHASESVVEAVTPYLDKLGKYRVGKQVVDTLLASAKNFDKAKSTKGGKNADKKGIDGKLIGQIATCDDLLDSIDRLMFDFRLDDSAFHVGYKDARLIRTAGVRHRPTDTPSEPDQPATPSTGSEK
jgi:hypothetical protein